MGIARFAALGLAAAGFLGLTAQDARADFNLEPLQNFVDLVNEQTPDGKSEEKAVAKINKTADKDYSDASSELKAFAKIAKTAEKGFSGNQTVMDALADLCDEEGGLDSLYWELQNGDGNIALAALTLIQNISDPVKLGKSSLKYYAKHLAKALTASSCSKALKFWAKAVSGAAKALKKYGEPSVG